MKNKIVNILDEIREQSQKVWESGFGGEFCQFQGDINDLQKYYLINYPVNGSNFIELNDEDVFNEIDKLLELSLSHDTKVITRDVLSLIKNETSFSEVYKTRSYIDGYNNQLHIAFVSNKKVFELIMYWSPD